MFRKLLVSAAIAALSASSAMADRIATITWTGKIASGTDDLGVFGAAGADLTDADFTSTLSFNLTQAQYQLGTLTQGSFVYPFFSGYDGGAVSSSFTLGGHTIAVGGNSYSSLFVRSDPDQVFGSGDQSEFDSSMQNIDGSTITVLFHRIGQDGQTLPWANLDVADYDGDVSGAQSDPNSNFFVIGNIDTLAFDQLYLTNQHLTIVNSIVASPAPEPASWAMMVGGFGLVGGALRSRRKATLSFA